MQIFQLIYASTPRYGLTSTDAENIAISARDKNRKSGVTGVLLISSTAILQVLEGEKSAVCTIYQLITKSRRHMNCDVLFTRHCAARSFPKWSMGYRSVENAADLRQKISTLKAKRDARNDALKIAS
jgi:hypothetical protein